MRQVHAQAGTQFTHSGTCPECSGRVVDDPKHGDRACLDCGLVVSQDTIDHGPEWRAYTADQRESRRRTGTTLTNRRHDKGLSTIISRRNRDSNGNQLSSRKRKQLNRLRTWNQRFTATDSDDRNLKHALGEIERMASALGIPDTIRETAAVIYRRALKANLLPGRSIEAIATAALYIATRQAGCPRTIAEIEPTSRVDTRTIARAYRYTANQLNINLEPESPEQYIDRLVTGVNCDATIATTARNLLTDARTDGLLSGKDPMGLAAAAVYTAAQLEDTDTAVHQNQLSDLANITTVTIRSHYKDFLSLRNKNYTPHPHR